MKEFLKKHKTIIILFIFSFIIRLIYILIAKTPIESDFKMMYNASLELINGTSEYKGMSYFINWGYQMGHVIYQAILLFFIKNPFFLKFMNCIITSTTVVFIYLISKINSSKKSSIIISIIYSLFPFPLFLNSVLSNQQMPLLLILIALYIFLKDNYNYKKSIIIGLLLGISNILRSETIVIIFSIFIFSLFQIKKLPLKKIIISFSIILIMYLSIFKGCSYALKISGISPNGLNNTNPYWKFVLGFNYETQGMYSTKDAEIYSGDPIKSKEETINRIKDYKKIPVHFIKKTKILWFNSDLSWSIGYIENTTLYKLFNTINQIFIIIFLLLSMISLKNLLKFNKVYLLCFIILFVYGGVYLLIEIMPRYAYNLQAFEAIISTFGLDYIIKKIKLNH